MAFLFSACAGSRPQPDEFPSEASEPVVSDSGIHFQLVYIVHGDADYVYHDSTGQKHFADVEALAQAQDVAEHSPRAEVFIFHQRTRHLKLFGQDLDGTVYQYRSGTRIHQENYSREQDSDWQEESHFLHQRSVKKPVNRFFIYFGHEIPMHDGEGYSQSYPDKKFSRAEFMRGFDRFAKPDSANKPFAISILSVCYGGTPPLLKALSPYSRYVVASPAYLHLSFLDTRTFIPGLQTQYNTMEDAEIHALADSLAGQSFRRLRENTQTEITVALYNMNKASPSELFPEGWRTQIEKYHDCALDPGFDPDAAREGVELYYQAPRFGASKYKANHSGWECPGKSFVFEKENTLPHAFESNGTQDIPENSFDTQNSRSQP